MQKTGSELLNLQDNDMCTPLHRAVKHAMCVRAMLEEAPDIVSDVLDVQSKLGCTALCLAAVSALCHLPRRHIFARACV